MAFPFDRSIGSELSKSRRREGATARAYNVGLSSVRKGEGSLDVLDADGDLANPLEVFGTLPDGSTGWGTIINGTMTNMRTHTLGELAAHATTLVAHDTRITAAQARADKGVADAATAQSTANGAVSVNNTQNVTLANLASRIGGLEGQSHVNVADYAAAMIQIGRQLDAIEVFLQNNFPGFVPA